MRLVVLVEAMIGRSFIVKNAEKFSEYNAKISFKNSLPLPRNRLNTERITQL